MFGAWAQGSRSRSRAIDPPLLQGPLARRLDRIRRRLALWAALDGLVGGAAVATAGAALIAGLARLRGHAPHPAALAAVVAAGALAGAAAGGLRRISRTHCARLADRALDGEDRVLSALWLAGTPSPLAEAAVADALARTARIEPRAVAPARAPRGLRALGLAAAVLAAIALVPSGTRAARLPAPKTAAAARSSLPAGALEVERGQAAAAVARAQREADPTARALAAELDRIVRGLAAGTLDESAALEALRGLEQAAREAEAAAAQDARAAQGAAAALAASPATRQAAEALRDPSRAGGTGDALSGAAASQPAPTAGALRAAAAAVAAAAGSSPDGREQPGRRRLNRDTPAGADQAASEPGARGADEQRHLERLARDLDEAAAACAAGDPSCGARAGSGGRELGNAQRRASGAPSLREVERTSRQLHDRIARGDLQPSESRAARAFAQAASGQPGSGREGAATPGSAPSPGDDRAGATPAPEGASASPDTTGGQGAAAAVADGTEAGQAATRGAAAGDTTETTGGGIGHENGGAPLGARDDAQAAAGRQESLSGADAAGPDRARVIVGAAGQGFASRPYARVYADYRAAVEDALGAGAVPPGQQYVVRRYFDLIRPRKGPAR